LPIQTKDRQAGFAGRFPIALGIVSNVKDLIWFQIDKLERTPENFQVGFIRADLAGNENVSEKFRDSKVLEYEP